MSRSNKSALSPAAAEEFYAEVYALCHVPDASVNRSFSLSGSDEVSTAFHVGTPHGLLEVSVLRPEWLTKLGCSVMMRFKDAPDIFPGVSGRDYDKPTGKWNITSGLVGGPKEVLAELAARLDWAQGLALA